MQNQRPERNSPSFGSSSREGIWLNSRKRCRDEYSNAQRAPYLTVKYVIRGNVMCRSGFMAVIQVSLATLHRHSLDVGTCKTFEIYETKRFRGRYQKTSVQTDISVAFLNRYADLYGLPCHEGAKAPKTYPFAIYRAVHLEKTFMRRTLVDGRHSPAL